MTTETLTIILSAIGIVLTLGTSLFAVGAWMIRRIDEQGGRPAIGGEHFTQHGQIIGDDRHARRRGLHGREAESLCLRWEDENIERRQKIADPFGRHFTGKIYTRF